MDDLRTLHADVVHRIGGRRYPGFMMYAWVEYKNKAVLDSTDFVRDQQVLATIPA